MKLLRIALFPVALIYGVVLHIRHFLFDRGVLKSQSFNKPVICVGNLSFGGTGKTPLTIYLAGLLAKDKKVAIISRGYRRKSKGFMLVTPDVQAEWAGDEPLEMSRRLPEVIVAVDRNRANGLTRLFEEFNAETAILDDGFQHRWVKPKLTILLTDYQRLYSRDFLFPAGRLRDVKSRAKKAQIVIVTKCPDDANPDSLRQQLRLLPSQSLYLSRISYQYVRQLFLDTQEPISTLSNRSILLITGIATPEYLLAYLGEKGITTAHKIYPDHHVYTSKDIKEITELFNNFDAPSKLLLTTEKDAVKLQRAEFKNLIGQLPFFVIGQATEFLSGAKQFEEELKKYA